MPSSREWVVGVEQLLCFTVERTVQPRALYDRHEPNRSSSDKLTRRLSLWWMVRAVADWFDLRRGDLNNMVVVLGIDADEQVAL